MIKKTKKKLLKEIKKRDGKDEMQNAKCETKVRT